MHNVVVFHAEKIRLIAESILCLQQQFISAGMVFCLE